MAKATWNGTVIAESDDTGVVEGNHCFPIESVDKPLLVDSSLRTTCPWKGEASCCDLVVNADPNPGSAFSYAELAIGWPSGGVSRSKTERQPMWRSSQVVTWPYQWIELAGVRIQWFSSG